MSGFSFPDKELVLAWAVLGCRAGNGFDVAADNLDDFPSGHVAVDAPSDVFYQDGQRDPEQELTGMVIQPKPGTYALILSCKSNVRIEIGRLGTMRLQPGYYVYLGSALGPGGCVPGSPTIRSCPHDPTGTSTTCECIAGFIVSGFQGGWPLYHALFDNFGPTLAGSHFCSRRNPVVNFPVMG